MLAAPPRGRVASATPSPATPVGALAAASRAILSQNLERPCSQKTLPPPWALAVRIQPYMPTPLHTIRSCMHAYRRSWCSRSTAAGGGCFGPTDFPVLLVAPGVHHIHWMRIPVTMCHGIRGRDKPEDSSQYPLSEAHFETLVATAAELGFTSINYDQLAAWRQVGERETKKNTRPDVVVSADTASVHVLSNLLQNPLTQCTQHEAVGGWPVGGSAGHRCATPGEANDVGCRPPCERRARNCSRADSPSSAVRHTAAVPYAAGVSS